MEGIVVEIISAAIGEAVSEGIRIYRESGKEPTPAEVGGFAAKRIKERLQAANLFSGN